VLVHRARHGVEQELVTPHERDARLVARGLDPKDERVPTGRHSHARHYRKPSGAMGVADGEGTPYPRSPRLDFGDVAELV
jgi:hypothetical protein